MRTIELRSDNAAGVAPHVMDAIVAADAGSALAYGDDDLTVELQERASDVFGTEAFTFPVVSGTAANALGLSAMCPPWGAVLCSESAHIRTSEAAATAMFNGGAELRGLAAPDGLIGADTLTRALADAGWDDPHECQPAVLSLTQTTEAGTVYTAAQLSELAEIARLRGLRRHLDGARLANALAATAVPPADMTWRAGVEVLSLGGIKNGTMNADAIVTFDPEIAHQLRFRLKRAGHVTSKMRYLSAQLIAYLQDGRWLAAAGHANAMAARLAAGLTERGFAPQAAPAANISFVQAPPEELDRWAAQDLLFYRMGRTRARLVTSFQTTVEDVDEALRRIDG